jgi:predicted thioesterase
MIPEGTACEGRIKVTKEITAASMGSGTLPVFATPAMILFIEKTASDCVKQFLQEGESTVGTLLEIKHSAPSVIGTEVFCKAEITKVDGPKIVFEIKVWDSAGEVGSGRHERFLINNEKFMRRAASRAEGR